MHIQAQAQAQAFNISCAYKMETPFIWNRKIIQII